MDVAIEISSEKCKIGLSFYLRVRCSSVLGGGTGIMALPLVGYIFKLGFWPAMHHGTVWILRLSLQLNVH